MRDSERLLICTLELESALLERRFDELVALLGQRQSILDKMTGPAADKEIEVVQKAEARIMSRLTNELDSVRQTLANSTVGRRSIAGYGDENPLGKRFEQSS